MRPISDRKPPNAAETPGARPKSAVLRNHEARSGPRSLAFRAATTQGRPSAAGIWEMSGKDSGLRSNKVLLEVLDIAEIILEPREIELPVGSRLPIWARVRPRHNDEFREGVYLIWTESNSDVVSVGSSGMVFGLQPGSAAVSAGDDQAMAEVGTSVVVVEAPLDRKRGADTRSSFCRRSTKIRSVKGLRRSARPTPRCINGYRT